MEAAMAPFPARVEINLAAIPVRGFGGACLVLSSIICAAVLPETRWFMAVSSVAGVVTGALMILIHRGDAVERRRRALLKTDLS
jgi:hypothetical protein